MKRYYIRCLYYAQAVALAKLFIKHYAKDFKYRYNTRCPSVKVDDNEFIFIHPGINTDGMRNIISSEEFIKKYFTQN